MNTDTLERSSTETPQTLVCPECENRLVVHVLPTTTSNGWTNAWCYRANLHASASSTRLRVAPKGRS